MITLIAQTLLSSVDQADTNIGYRIALVGMLTVFFGLVILASSLPLIRRMAEGKTKQTAKGAAPDDKSELNREEMVAVIAAVHAHVTKLNKIQDMQLTWEMYEKPYTPWRLAGRSRLLMDRSAFRQRNRSR